MSHRSAVCVFQIYGERTTGRFVLTVSLWYEKNAGCNLESIVTLQTWGDGRVQVLVLTRVLSDPIGRGRM